MQQQPHRAPTTPASRKTMAPRAAKSDLHSAPIVLDLQQLKHVSGGGGEAVPAPKKFW
jgi:hypothetical protein